MTDEVPDVLAMALADVQDDINAPSDSKLKLVERLINEQVLLEDLKESLEAQLKDCEKKLAEVSERKLPEALLDAGCTKFETPEGLGIKTEEIYYPAVTKPNFPAFLDWLAENGHDGIATSDLIIEFGKGNYKQAKELRDRLESLLDEYDIEVPSPPKVSGDIHWATFRAFAKEQAKAETKFPDIYSAYSVTKAKITRPKKKK